MIEITREEREKFTKYCVEQANRKERTEMELEQIKEGLELVNIGVRVCSVCNKTIYKGISNEDGDSYCSETCATEHYSTDELAEALDCESLYYTDWI